MKKEQLEQYRLALEIENRKLNGEDVEWQRFHHGECWQDITSRFISALDIVALDMPIRLTPKITQQEKWIKDGKKVQFSIGEKNKSWHDWIALPFDYPDTEWRIKPDPKKVPLTNKDIIIGTRLKYQGYEFVVVEVNHKRVGFGNTAFRRTYDDLMKDCQMWNGNEWVECSKIECDV